MGFDGFYNLDPIQPANVEESMRAAQDYLDKSKTHLGDETIQTIIKSGESGQTILSTALELNVDIITKLRIETVFLPFRQEVFPIAKFNLAEVQKEILEHYLYGLCTPEGQKLIKKYEKLRLKTN
jgi:hypothetical protein